MIACVRASGGVDQAEGENHEDDEADNRVQAVAFESEADDGHGDTRDGRGDEEQQAKLNESQTLEVRRGDDDSGERSEMGAAGSEGAIVDAAGMTLDEREDAPREDGCSGEKNADLQEAANDGFEAAVIHGAIPSP